MSGYSTSGPLLRQKYQRRETGERTAELRANLYVEGDLDVAGDLTQNGEPLAAGITNTAPADSVPVTADAAGNLIGDSKLTFNRSNSMLSVSGATQASFGVLANTVTINITGQTGDGSLIFRLTGLPRTDPVSEGRFWVDSNGFVKMSDG